MRKVFEAIAYPKRTFRLQYASNLFVDCHKQPFQALVEPFPNTDTIALLGNIGHPESNRTYAFLEHCTKFWDRVIWILGPHEISNKKGENKIFYELTDKCLTLANHFPERVSVLNHNELYLHKENVAMVGATLWTQEPLFLRGQPEFSRILKDRVQPLTPKTYITWNNEDADFLYIRGRYYKATEATAPLFFLTHHLPVPHLVNTGLTRETYERTSLDVNNYRDRLRPGISVWLSGATGSCSSGYMGPDPTRRTFCAVNSCYEYPYKENAKPNPGYFNKMIVEVVTHEPEKRPDSKYPPVQGLPPLVSSMLKPKVS